MLDIMHFKEKQNSTRMEVFGEMILHKTITPMQQKSKEKKNKSSKKPQINY